MTATRSQVEEERRSRRGRRGEEGEKGEAVIHLQGANAEPISCNVNEYCSLNTNSSLARIAKVIAVVIKAKQLA